MEREGHAAAPRIALCDLGQQSYHAALAEQERLLVEVAEGRALSTMLFVEHVPAVVTRGRGLQPGGLALARPVHPSTSSGRTVERGAEAAAGEQGKEGAGSAGIGKSDGIGKIDGSDGSDGIDGIDVIDEIGGLGGLGGIDVIDVARGGGLTWHGPGQLVGYPIVRLAKRDVGAYLRALEQGVIDGLEALGVAATRREGATGVWVATPRAGAPAWRKVASIGVGFRRWTSWHGFAVNVHNDPAVFAGFDPCGFPSEVMTSVTLERGIPTSIADARAALGPALRRALEPLSACPK